MKVSRKFGKTKNRMGGHHLEGHIRDLRNTMTEDTRTGQRRMKVSFEGGQGPQGAIVP